MTPFRMSLLRRLFKAKPAPPVLDHPQFGELHFSRHDGLVNSSFELWGHGPFELLVDAPESGPSPAQEEAFRRFESAKEFLLPRCVAKLDVLRAEMQLPAATFVVAGLTIPSLDSKPQGRLWTLWFDAQGDDHFLYGIQTDDDWNTLQAFADD